jgi:predicted TIM-barrel fold metal-dependent hydrolase
MRTSDGTAARIVHLDSPAVEDVLERARSLIAGYDEELERDLPAGVEIFDAHVHLGHDIDGFSGSYDELARIDERYGITRSFVFCMDEPDRHPAFRAANDRTLEHARRSGERLIPFVRLDLAEEPIEEATRCLDAGARGIKLHPRAQRFLLNDERLAPVFALAAERRVPILIHGGRGLPPIADHLERLVDAYPEAQLIIAHAGIADLAELAGRFAGKPGVFFDTSVWSAIDLLSLLHLVSPEQVVYGSDYPYGQQPSSLLISVRTAKVAGLDDDALRGLLWENASRIAAGEPPPELTSPRGAGTFSQPMAFARIHQYLSMATPLLWTRQADTIGVIGLALNACADRDGHVEERERIRELLEAARDLWRTLPELDDEAEQRIVGRTTFRLVHLADILAVTSGV